MLQAGWRFAFQARNRSWLYLELFCLLYGIVRGSCKRRWTIYLQSFTVNAEFDAKLKSITIVRYTGFRRWCRFVKSVKRCFSTVHEFNFLLTCNILISGIRPTNHSIDVNITPRNVIGMTSPDETNFTFWPILSTRIIQNTVFYYIKPICVSSVNIHRRMRNARFWQPKRIPLVDVYFLTTSSIQ